MYAPADQHTARRISRRRRSCFAVAVAVTVAALAAMATPVSAHDGRAIITLETSEQGADSSVAYVVRVVWDNDGHPAKDASATVLAIAADGQRIGPIGLAPVDDDGRYGATVPFGAPGEWTVRFTVVTPPGSLDVPQSVTSSAPVVSVVPATTAATTSTIDSTGPSTSISTDAPPRRELGATGRPTSTSGALVFFGATAMILVGAGYVVFQSRRKRQGRSS